MKKLDPQVAESVAKAITDEAARKILVCTASESKTVEEISSETGIPLATCYRKVAELVRYELLAVEKIVLPARGKKVEKFKRTFRHLRISLDGNGLAVWDDDSPIIPFIEAAPPARKGTSS
jgi:hypothetical protein